MKRCFSITFMLMVTILWTETVARHCPEHCTCDYEGTSYCSFGNSKVTLSLEDLGFEYSNLEINCEDIKMNCSDLPELGAFGVYTFTSYDCSPRILRCLKHILGDVQLNKVILNDLSDALLREDVTDLTGVTALSLRLTDDIIINSDAIYGWPSLSEVRLKGGTLHILPNNNITNKSLQDISLKSTKICSIPVGGFNGLTNLKTFAIYQFRDPWGVSPKSTCEEGDIDIHVGAFKGLTELHKLALGNIKSIEPGAFADTPKLTNMLITDSPLGFLPNGVFEGMKSLYKIVLECRENEIKLDTHALSQNVALEIFSVKYCRFNHLPDDLFSNSNNITQIEIVVGRLNNVPKIFSPLSALEYISLNGNGIDELPDKVFKNLTSLRTLELAYNSIMKLQCDIFSDLLALSNLELHDNKIQEIPEIIFSRLTSLRVLLLHNNKIQNLPGSVFSNLHYLNQLSLNNNDIHELPEGIFASLTALNSLSLGDNHITKLHENSFINLSSLLDLDLSNNNLEELPNNVFTTLTSLNKLILHTNKLKALPDFRNLTSLKELDLSNNFIVSLSPHSFEKQRNLEILKLRNNTIYKLEARQVFPSIDIAGDTPTSPFDPLEKLVTLDLSSNHLRQLYKDWQDDLRQIRTLNLSYNRFTNIKDLQVNYSDMKIDIDLQFNEISEVILDPRVSNSIDIPIVWDTSIVELSNNPIVCNCNAYGLYRRVRGVRLPHEPRYYSHHDSEQIICAAPPNLKGYLLKDLQPEQLVCDLSKHLPDNCSSYTARAVTNEVILSCPKMPSTWIDFKVNDFLYVFFEQPIITLNLEYQPKSIEHHNIHTLNLSNTKLHDIAFALTDSLKVLDLSHNNLVSVPDAFLKANITLYLADNPLLCDCLLVRKFNNMNTLADAMSISCVNEGKLKDINEDELCHRLQSLTTVIGVSVVCSALVIMITIPICKYIKRNWENISRTFGFSSKHNSESIELPKTKVNKQFDLLIAFAYEDEEFVRENLLPKLKFEFNQKCCVHDCGETDEDLITDQIIQSVDDSTKTVIILTHTSLTSQLTHMAFSRAHFLTKQDGKSRIIIIILDKNITQNEGINDDLKSYITTDSCLVWGDPNFWTMLKDILPRRKEMISVCR